MRALYISNLINRFSQNFGQKIERIFPERQLYFRSNGVVRFISISRYIQISISLVVLALCAWSILTSYSFIHRAEILASKDAEIAIAQEKYLASNDQFDTLKNKIEQSTKTLEQRQIYLEQLLDTDKSLSNSVIDAKKMTGKAGDGQDSEEISLYSEHETNMDRLGFNLERIEKQQRLIANKMFDRISTKIAYVEDTLKNSGIKSSKLVQLAENRPSLSMAMGGPFILYSESNNVDLLTDEPFARLYANHNRLIDLESAIQHVPIGKPTKKYYISSSFGIRKDPFKKKWARHQGVDMAGWWKTPIYASANGTVYKAGRNGAYGNFIEIDHGNGFRSRYGHLSKIKVKKGDKVTLDQEIGLMGSTGRSTSPHLHYEIWFNGKPINPQKIFKAAENVLKIQRQEYDS